MDMSRRCRKCMLRKVCHRKRSYNNWLKTYTKKVVTVILQIAESLSSTIASTVVGVMLGYFLKALFETFFEKREERLNRSEPTEEINYEEEI